MYDPEILEATRALCRAGGALNLRVLYQELLQRCNTNEEEFLHIMNGCSRFLLVPGSAGDGEGRPEDCTVVARTSLRLCSAYYHERCAEGVGCQQLHLCRYFIYGNCRFDKGRKSCKYSHDLGSDHNQQLLRECTLQELHEDHLRLLLLQNDPELLPEVSCTKIHLCQHFVKGDCMFGLRCKRQHTIDQHGRHMLEDRGLSGDLMEELPFIYRNMYNLKNADTEKNVEPVNEGGEEICLHFIRNSCKFNNECSRVHFHLPYKWEIFNDRTWTELQDMEDIERDFCDPSKNHSCTHLPVDFLSMRRGSKPVRRLSTISSVLKPPHYVLTTEWLWYYKGEQGNWIEYGHPDEKQRTTSVTSQTLEVSFQSNRTGVIEVVKGNRQYVLSFKDMYQRNPKHNTKRRVCRRPRFVPVVEVQRKWG